MAREVKLTGSGEFAVPLSGVPGVLTSESGQGGDWLGVEAVVSLLPHLYLCPQTHPVSTAGARVNETAWHLWGAQTPGRAMEMEVQEAVDKDEARPSYQPHSPPVLSLFQTASCLCFCFLCLHSSCRCCLVSGPFGKVQSICPEDSLPHVHPPATPNPCGLGLSYLYAWSWLPTFEDPSPHPCGCLPHPPACQARMPPNLSRSQTAAQAQCTAS